MSSKGKIWREIPLYVMLAPAVVLVLVYGYAPMVGIVMAFQRVLPGRGIFGSPWQIDLAVTPGARRLALDPERMTALVAEFKKIFNQNRQQFLS